jgi:chromosome segregation ATPase
MSKQSSVWLNPNIDPRDHYSRTLAQLAKQRGIKETINVGFGTGYTNVAKFDPPAKIIKMINVNVCNKRIMGLMDKITRLKEVKSGKEAEIFELKKKQEELTANTAQLNEILRKNEQLTADKAQVDANINRLLGEHTALMKQHRTLTGERDTVIESLKLLNSKKEEVEATLRQTEAEFAQLRKEHGLQATNITNLKRELAEEKDKVAVAMNANKKTVDELNQQISKLEAQIHDLSNANNDMVTNVKILEEELDRVKLLLSKSEKENNLVSKQRDELQKERDALHKKSDELNDEIKKLHKETAMYSELMIKFDKVQDELRKNTDEMKKITVKLTKSQLNVLYLNQTIFDLEAQVEKLQADGVQKDKDIERCRAETVELTNELNGLRPLVKELKDVNAKLEQKGIEIQSLTDRLRNEQGNNRALKDKLTQNIEEHKQKVAELIKQKDALKAELEKQLENMNVQWKEAQVSLQSCKSNLAIAQKNNDQNEKTIQDQQAHNQHIIDTIRTKENELTGLKSQNTNLTGVNSRQTEEINRLQGELSELNKLRQKYATQEDHLANLRAANAEISKLRKELDSENRIGKNQTENIIDLKRQLGFIRSGLMEMQRVIINHNINTQTYLRADGLTQNFEKLTREYQTEFEQPLIQEVRKGGRRRW